MWPSGGKGGLSTISQETLLTFWPMLILSLSPLADIIIITIAVASFQSHSHAERHSSTDQLVVFYCRPQLGLGVCYEVDQVSVSSCDSGNDSVMSQLGNGVRDRLGHHRSVGQHDQRLHYGT